MTLEQLNDFKERFRDAFGDSELYHLAADLLIALEQTWEPCGCQKRLNAAEEACRGWDLDSLFYEGVPK